MKLPYVRVKRQPPVLIQVVLPDGKFHEITLTEARELRDLLSQAIREGEAV